MFKYIVMYPKKYINIILGAVFVSSFGVALGSLFELPWVGTSIIINGVEIESSRQWTTGGIELDRVGGFARMSSHAAVHIMTFILLLLPYLWSKNRDLSVLFFIIGLVLIYLTTTKSIVAAYFIAFIVFVIHSKLLFRIVIILVSFLCVILSFASRYISYDFNYYSDMSKFLLASFEDRLVVTWPYTLDIIEKYGLPVFGRGLGGCGAGDFQFGSLKLITGDAITACDNLALFLFCNFGFIGLCLLFVITMSSIRLNEDKCMVRSGLGLALFGLLVASLSTDVVENLLALVIIGVSIYAVFDAQQRKFVF